MTAFVYRYSGACLLIWILFIFILCATPGQYIPTANWMDYLSIDKWVHAGIFFVLCLFSFLFAFKRKQNTACLYLYTGLGTLYGISLEMMQAKWFSGRYYDIQDMVANAVGCALALLLHKTLYRYFKIWAA